ncbi:hypothetical protein CBW65_12035 [Tumebacillus avium]|uniref:Uncharacterized protein n=1 Tax=Tumebacillus avium TaxID=1903704 RepID=A0A1Y0IPC1_9BACL|nr:hypothetical protein [Tumebacillus avium]ARU61666.1 hypothetical protein CBW65_12035 [Tumebacillus avium]
MRKLLVASLLTTLLVSVSANSVDAAYGRWYGGYKPPTWSENYYGVHAAISTPSTTPYTYNDGAYSFAANFIDVSNVSKLNPEIVWWVQIGWMKGYDHLSNYKSTPTTYVEWGPSNNLSETFPMTQPLNTTYDYWIRWDLDKKAWKVNIANSYIDWFYLGTNTAPARVTAQSEVNWDTNKNGPTRFSGTTYLSSDLATWSPFNGGFNLTQESGYTVTGTRTDFTVTR